MNIKDIIHSFNSGEAYVHNTDNSKIKDSKTEKRLTVKEMVRLYEEKTGPEQKKKSREPKETEETEKKKRKKRKKKRKTKKSNTNTADLTPDRQRTFQTPLPDLPKVVDPLADLWDTDSD